MSLSKQKRLEQKRAVILKEAKNVLIKHGKNATMGNIANALDMDKSSLYYYKGITEILNTILDQEYYDFSVDIQKLRRDNRSHVQVLKELARLILEFYYENLEIVQIILSQVFPLFLDPERKEDSTAINSYMESYRLANKVMMEEIKPALKNNEFKTDFSPEMILQTLRGAISGVCAAWKSKKPPHDRIYDLVDRIFLMYN
ncbi:hypothetical protein ES703_101659 [subsurface metagenome]